jgi:hypothetical protein
MLWAKRQGKGKFRAYHDLVFERFWRRAETAGVFGVPSFIVEGELFWGREHLADIREKIAPLARSNPAQAAVRRHVTDADRRGRTIPQ